MTTSISEYPNVSNRASELGCNIPERFAILPINFETANSMSELRLASESATIKTLLRSADLPQSELFNKKDRPPYIQNNAFEWIAPTLFISSAILSSNPELVAISLSVISNYVTDFFKGKSGRKNVKMDIVIEISKSKTCKKLTYEGPPEGLKDTAEVIKAMRDE